MRLLDVDPVSIGVLVLYVDDHPLAIIKSFSRHAWTGLQCLYVAGTLLFLGARCYKQ